MSFPENQHQRGKHAQDAQAHARTISYPWLNAERMYFLALMNEEHFPFEIQSVILESVRTVRISLSFSSGVSRIFSVRSSTSEKEELMIASQETPKKDSPGKWEYNFQPEAQTNWHRIFRQQSVLISNYLPLSFVLVDWFSSWSFSVSLLIPTWLSESLISSKYAIVAIFSSDSYQRCKFSRRFSPRANGGRSEANFFRFASPSGAKFFFASLRIRRANLGGIYISDSYKNKRPTDKLAMRVKPILTRVKFNPIVCCAFICIQYL